MEEIVTQVKGKAIYDIMGSENGYSETKNAALPLREYLYFDC